MTEYGLSVSLNGTPRTPRTPRGSESPSSTNTGVIHAPRKQILRFGYLISDSGGDDSGDSDDSDIESISPRRLDFSSIHPVIDFDDVSLISLASSGAGGAATEPVLARSNDLELRSVGECGICYASLPVSSNHIFTICSHLFCVRCFLKWWDTSSTCPMCRAQLFVDADAGADAGAADAGADAGADVGAMAVAAVAMAGVAVAVAVAGGEAAVPVDSWVGGAGEDLWVDEVDVNNTMIYRNPNIYHYPSNPLTLMNRYLNLDQDLRLFWSVCITEFEETDINYDDTVGPLTEYEIYKLRRNREIATALFSRIRFRETLFNPSIDLLGGVFPARWVPRENWYWFGERDYSSTNMYEIVIRRGELTSIDETNFFGFIKEVVVMYIPSEDNGDDGEHEYDIHDAEWDHFHEYVFVADVFTPTSFRSSIGEGVVGSVWNCHGEYDMDEGMVRLSEVRIRFSQVRRLYIMNSHEQLLVS